MAIVTLISIFIIANLHWISDRLFCIYPLKVPKNNAIRFVEILLFYMFSLLVSIACEVKFSGESYPQDWEFFIIIFCLFIVMMVPGIIFRYQWLPLDEQRSA